jgi:lysophospholipase L1-like esterase
VFLYPSKEEYLAARQGKEWLPERSEIESIAASDGLAVIDVAQQPEWNESLYRPDGVHPTVAGNQVLALVLAAAVKPTLQ